MKKIDLEDRRITVCAGPPACSLEGDEAVRAAQLGCQLCTRITIRPDGSEVTEEPARH